MRTAGSEGVMREQLVAWAGDCMVRGAVDLGQGRLSDLVNELETVTFFDATMRAIDDGHELALSEVEVGRDELHVVEISGRRGDPTRRLRTIQERVLVELGPYRVTGNLHRPPSTQPMASLSRFVHFVPMTDADIVLDLKPDEVLHQATILVNRDRIRHSEIISEVPVYASDPWPPLPAAPVTN